DLKNETDSNLLVVLCLWGATQLLTRMKKQFQYSNVSPTTMLATSKQTKYIQRTLSIKFLSFTRELYVWYTSLRVTVTLVYKNDIQAALLDELNHETLDYVESDQSAESSDSDDEDITVPHVVQGKNSLWLKGSAKNVKILKEDEIHALFGLYYAAGVLKSRNSEINPRSTRECN
ncbi:hypothetical protein L9F63_016918, partial [Diploptera punctata]